MSPVRLTFDRRPSDEESDASLLAKRLFAGVNRPQTETNEQPDPLAAFGSEQKDQPGQEEPEVVRRPAPWVPAPMPATVERRPLILRPRIMVPGMLALLAGALAAVTYFEVRSGSPGLTSPPATPGGGRVAITSNPAGAQVLIDGEARGVTPIDVVLPAGVHMLQLQRGGVVRALPLNVVENQTSSQYIELAGTGDASSSGSPPAASPPTAVSRVATPPPAPSAAPAGSLPTAGRGASGQASGRAPQTPAQSPTSRTPAPRSGTPPPATTPRGEGMMSIDLPFPVEVSEGGRVLGTIAGGPLRLPTGLHTLDLSNATYGFRTTLAVNIAAGATTRTPVTLPNGSLSVNALPWAEVFVDGRTIGLTPLANVAVPIGSREIVWRHPTLGERRQTIAVTGRAPVRIGIDYSR